MDKAYIAESHFWKGFSAEWANHWQINGHVVPSDTNLGGRLAEESTLYCYTRRETLPKKAVK